MTIIEIRKILIQLEYVHGNIEVYFDCPKCNCAFTPNKVVTVAVHITDEK